MQIRISYERGKRAYLSRDLFIFIILLVKYLRVIAITLLWIFYTRMNRAHLHLEISHKPFDTLSIILSLSNAMKSIIRFLACLSYR